MRGAQRAKLNTSVLHEPVVFLIPQEPDILQALCCFAQNRAARADRARTKPDMSSQRGFYGWKLVFILWLLDFLNMGFPLYGGAPINTHMLKESPRSPRAFAPWFTRHDLF